MTWPMTPAPNLQMGAKSWCCPRGRRTGSRPTHVSSGVLWTLRRWRRVPIRRNWRTLLTRSPWAARPWTSGWRWWSRTSTSCEARSTRSSLNGRAGGGRHVHGPAGARPGATGHRRRLGRRTDRYVGARAPVAGTRGALGGRGGGRYGSGCSQASRAGASAFPPIRLRATGLGSRSHRVLLV